MLGLVVHAQDFKQVSSSLAAKIDAAGRKKVAVVDFTDLQGNVSELGRYLAEELSGVLAEEAHGFRVVDRSHLKVILQEHKLASTGLIDPQTARQLGRFTGVDTLVTGTITSAFGDSVRVSVKALDAETAEIIAQSHADVPKTKAVDELLQHGIGGAPANPEESSNPHRMSEINQPSTMKVEEDQFLFEFACLRSGQSVECSGTVTNKAPQTRSLCPQGGYFIDNQGNKYSEIRSSLYLRQLDLPTIREVSYQQPERPRDVPCLEGLEPDLRMHISFSAKGVDTAATTLTYIGTFAWNYGDHFASGGKGAAIGAIIGQTNQGFKLTVRNIPIRQR